MSRDDPRIDLMVFMLCVLGEKLTVEAVFDIVRAVTAIPSDGVTGGGSNV